MLKYTKINSFLFGVEREGEARRNFRLYFKRSEKFNFAISKSCCLLNEKIVKIVKTEAREKRVLGKQIARWWLLRKSLIVAVNE